MNVKELKTIQVRPIQQRHSVFTSSYKRHTNFEILWFTKIGICKHQYIDHEKYPVKEHTVSLIAKGQIHRMSSAFEGYSIIIPSYFFSIGDNRNLRLIFNPFMNQPLLLEEPMLSTLQDVLKMVLEEMKTTQHEYVINAYMSVFLYKLSLLSSSASFKPGSFSRIESLFSLLEQNYLKERRASFYADRMGLTTNGLNDIMKKRIGLTITQLIHKLIIAEAKRMIGKDNKSIKEIAFELAFSEQAYFSRFFKKQAGITPEQFLKSVRNAEN